MDPIITKLNSAVQDAVKGSSSGADVAKPSTNFQQTLDDSITTRLMEKVQEGGMGHPRNDMTVLSAENINIQMAGSEVGGAQAGGDGQFYSMLKDLNKDFISLDSTIDVLSTPGVKLSPEELLACQAGIANFQITGEAFSRFTDSVARGIQTVLQTQVG